MRESDMIIKTLQVTEKGARLKEAGNKYFFLVAPSANKIEIKNAVERMFKVDVVSVNTMNYSGKRKRLRTARYGMTSDWKRAIVTLKEGNKIDLG